MVEAKEIQMLLVAEPVLGEREKELLSQVIDSSWITMGDRVREFEQAFAKAHGMPDAVAVSSCTAGLHLALAALDIGPGDEVLVPSLSFVATANCAIYVGASPVFVDIENINRPLISIEDAAAKCTARTKAIIVMHYAGYLVDRESWRAFARDRGLVLVEDAAHAAGAHGAGTIGDITVFSFYGNKNMTTAEGGMIVSDDPESLSRIRQMRALGMSSGTRDRLHSRAPTYDVTMLGWNYRMDELRAAIGRVQLDSLFQWNQKRRSLDRSYRDALEENCPAVSVVFSNTRGSSAYHLLPVLLPRGTDRQSVMGKMSGKGVQTTFHYPPIHSLSFYRNRFKSLRLRETEEFARRELTLPLHPRMSDDDVSIVAQALREAIA